MTTQVQTKVRSLEEALYRLQISGSFYATIISALKRRPVTSKICNTIGVVYNKDSILGIELLYNEDFIRSLTSLDELTFIVEHEASHLIMKHMERFYQNRKLQTVSKEIFDVAADLAVNSMLLRHHPNLPESFLSRLWRPSDFGLQSGLSMEQYATLLQAKALQRYTQGDKISGSISEEKPEVDVDFLSSVSQDKAAAPQHLWGYKLSDEGELEEATREDADLAECKQDCSLSGFVGSMVKVYNQSHGDLPDFVKEVISNFLNIRNSIPWTEVLKSRIVTGMRGIKTRSMRRPSRRRHSLPEAIPRFPGLALDNTYKIALVIDSSGSMSTGDLEAGKSVVKDLLEKYATQVEVTVAYADTTIHKLQKITSIEQFDMEIQGRGGTDFVQPITQLEETVRPDIIVYFTDGYGTAPEKPPRATVVWCISPHGCNPTENLAMQYGYEVRIAY